MTSVPAPDRLEAAKSDRDELVRLWNGPHDVGSGLFQDCIAAERRVRTLEQRLSR